MDLQWRLYVQRKRSGKTSCGWSMKLRVLVRDVNGRGAVEVH